MASLEQNYYTLVTAATPTESEDNEESSDEHLMDAPQSPLVSSELLDSFFQMPPAGPVAEPPDDLPLDGVVPVKKKFTDLLEENGDDSVPDDVITKIFSQTIQVPTSDEATPTTDDEEEQAEEEVDGEVAMFKEKGAQILSSSATLISGQKTPTIIIDTCTWTNGKEEDDDDEQEDGKSESDPPDKVPLNLSHFNETICDDDEDDDAVILDPIPVQEIDDSYDVVLALDHSGDLPAAAELVPDEEIQEFEDTERKIEMEEFENEKNLKNLEISYNSQLQDESLFIGNGLPDTIAEDVLAEETVEVQELNSIETTEEDVSIKVRRILYVLRVQWGKFHNMLR